jgi:ubiquinol-cytochrome c reductase cytochrome c subunit
VKSLVTFVGVITIASVLSAQTPAPAPGAGEAPRGNAENGKKIFTTYGCYQCHNYAANGGGAGPRLAPRPISWSAFTAEVRKPRDEMPPYSTKMVSDQELADIYAFLRSIPEPPAVQSIPLLNNP